MNKWIGLGNICNNLELRYTTNNIPIIKFSIAINQGYGDEQKTDYVNCITWRKQAENLSKYCTKGSKIAIEGRLQSYSYEDNNGDKKYGMQVVAETITFLNNKKETYAEQVQNSKHATEDKTDPFEDFGNEIQLSDDMLPF